MEMVVSRPNGDVTEPLRFNAAEEVVHQQAKNRGNARDGWRLKTRGDEFGTTFHDFQKMMDRWSQLAQQHDKKGDVIVLDIMEHPYSVVARWVDTMLPIKDTSGNRDIDQIWTWWHEQWPNSRNAGICVFKYTGGRPSQHCNWNDNNGEPGDGSDASDEFLNGMEMMKDAAYEAVNFAKQDELPLGRMIIANLIWDPFQGWHYYGGEYHYHNHMEGRWWLINGYARRC